MAVMNIITKFVAIIVVIVLVMVGVFYSLGGENDASVMDVRVGVLLDGAGNAHITYINGSMRDVNKISVPKGGAVDMPGVVANVVYEEDFIGYWTSVKLDPNAPLNATTNYNLTIGLFNNPEIGENISISVRLVGYVGEEIDSVITTFKIP